MEYFDNDIMTIDYSVMEAEAKVMSTMYEHCQKMIMLYEHGVSEDLVLNMFMEDGSSNSNSKNDKKPMSKIKTVITTVLNTIKSIFRWIGRKLLHAVQWIRSLFTKNKNPASADQCAKRSGIKPRSGQDVSGSNEKFKFNIFQRTDPKKAAKPVTLDIQAMAKQLSIEYTNDGNIVIDFGFALDLNSEVGNKIKGRAVNSVLKKNKDFIKGKEAPDLYLIHLYNFVTNSSYLDNLETYIDKMSKILNHDINDASEIKKITSDAADSLNNCEAMISQISWYKVSNFSISIKDLQSIYKRIQKLLAITESFSISENIPDIDNSVVIQMGKYVEMLNVIQMGLNLVTNAIISSYTIDKRYVGQCNDTETLSKFVSELISHGIPPKFVGYNTFLIMDGGWTGMDPKKGTKGFEPVWGQSRIVFLPYFEPGIVHKVATSGFGIQANKNENHVYNVVKRDPNLSKNFGKVEHISNNGVVLDMERLDCTSSPGYDVIYKVMENIDHSTVKMDFTVGDLHNGNFGKTDSGDWVISDYGWVLGKGK